MLLRVYIYYYIKLQLMRRDDFGKRQSDSEMSADEHQGTCAEQQGETTPNMIALS